MAIYPLCALFSRSRLRVDVRHQHVLFWGGLRGALALASRSRCRRTFRAAT